MYISLAVVQKGFAGITLSYIHVVILLIFTLVCMHYINTNKNGIC